MFGQFAVKGAQRQAKRLGGLGPVASRKAKRLLEQALFVDTLEFAQVPGLHAGRFRFLGRGAGGDVQRADGEVALEGVLQFADVPRPVIAQEGVGDVAGDERRVLAARGPVQEAPLSAVGCLPCVPAAAADE